MSVSISFMLNSDLYYVFWFGVKQQPLNSGVYNFIIAYVSTCNCQHLSQRISARHQAMNVILIKHADICVHTVNPTRTFDPLMLRLQILWSFSTLPSTLSDLASEHRERLEVATPLIGHAA